MGRRGTSMQLKNINKLFSVFLFLGWGCVAVAATSVELIEINREPVVAKSTLVGNLRAHDQVELAAEVAGIIAKISFAEGQKVRRGQVLIELDDELFKAEVRRAEASYQLAKMRFDRDSKLFEKNTISQAVYEQTRAELQVSKAALDVAQVRLDKTQVFAPFDGFIGLRKMSVGDYVSAGESLLHVINDTPILLDFNLPQKLAGSLQVGDSVEFKVANRPEIRSAKVIAIEPSMISTSRAQPVRAEYENNERDVLSGNFADVHISVESPLPQVVIPAQALIGISGGYIVYIVQEDKAERHHVRIVRRDAEKVVLEDNFPVGAKVVIAGHQRLRPGDDVVAVNVGG